MIFFGSKRNTDMHSMCVCFCILERAKCREKDQIAKERFLYLGAR